MSVYIENIEITNYRSCKKTMLAPDRRLSALIGVNGSGKSNLLQGILLLRKVSRMTRSHAEDELPLSSCKVRITFNVNRLPVRYEALVRYSTNERNIDEVAEAIQKWNFKAFTGKDSWIKFPIHVLLDARRFGIRPQGRTGRDYSRLLAKYLALYGRKSKSLAPLKQVAGVIGKVAGLVASTTYYSASQFTDPSRCPTSLEIESEGSYRRSPRQKGEHFQFMFDLYTTFKAKKAEFEEFRSIVGADGIGLVDDIKYDEISVPSSVYQVITGGRVIRKVVEKLLVIPNFVIGGSKLSPNQLSEGTFKTLALVFYLVTDRSRLLLLEEPEVCVHHGLLSSILEIIKAFSRRKQIIISTHSDFVLDALAPENVFVVKCDQTQGTTVRHVPASMSARQYQALKAYLEESGNLGEYWRHGELEK